VRSRQRSTDCLSMRGDIAIRSSRSPASLPFLGASGTSGSNPLSSSGESANSRFPLVRGSPCSSARLWRRGGFAIITTEPNELCAELHNREAMKVFFKQVPEMARGAEVPTPACRLCTMGKRHLPHAPCYPLPRRGAVRAFDPDWNLSLNHRDLG
jgi:hypothetical protein